MKLRSHLLIANGISIGFILICLLASYFKMYLSLGEIIWLSVVTIIAGIISFFTHLFLTRPIQQAISLISKESKRIADGEFKGQVPRIGPLEFQELAGRFNEMSQKLEKSFTQIQQSEVSRRELVANISHDLRTPLASIQSFVEALQDDIIQDKETFERYLQTIRLETKRISNLIDDLFQLSQLDSGTEDFTPQPYYLDHLILETLQNQLLHLEAKDIEVSVDIPVHISPVNIMPEKIMRVLINLIQNAIIHSPEGSEIKIRAEDISEDFVKVIVADRGKGIPEDQIPYVFERFYRVEKSRNKDHGGAGLGLSIAKSIINLHGGEIGIQSKEKEGSAVWFTLRKSKSFS